MSWWANQGILYSYVRYVLILFLLAECVLLPKVIYGQQITRAQQHYALGLRLERQGKWAEAASEFSKAIQINPEFAGAYFELGRASRRSGNLKEAIRALTQLTELDPGSNKGRLLLAQIYLDSENLAHAVTLYSQALQRAPSDPIIYYELGTIAYRERDDSQSVILLEKALSFDPAMNNARRLLISVFEATGDYKDAIERLYEALLLEPHAPDLLTNLGELYTKTGRPAKAETAFRTALAVRGDFVPAEIGFGIVCRLTGRLPAAIELFSRVIQDAPTEAQAYLERGRAEYAEGHIRSAQADFEIYCRMAPGRPEGNYFMGLVDCAEGEYALAVQRLKKALAADPSSEEGFYLLALTYLHLNEPKEAADALERCLSLPGSSGPHNAAGKLLRELQKEGLRVGPPSEGPVKGR